MKQQIDLLIANALLDEGEVYLPEVGTLILYRHAAELLSKRELQRPYRELRLTKEQRGESLLSLISQVASVSEERVADIYAEWLAQSLRNNVLTISGICLIERDKITTIDKTFEDMANPNGRGRIKVNPRTNYFIYIIAGLCMGFALGIAGYVLYTNGTFDRLLAKQTIAPASEAFDSVTEAPAEVIEPVAEVVEQPAKQSVVVAEQPVEEVVAVAAQPAIVPMQKGSSYGVWGVYNELHNAEDAKAWLATKFPEIEANIYQYDARYMVALCEVSSRSECGRKVTAWKAQSKSFNNVWVYTR